MIKINQLTKKYGDKEVVKNLSFEIQKGDIFGFLGPNGAGKTTTIKIITDQLNATSGYVSIDGVDVRDKKELYEDIGIVFELPNLYMKETIKKNLMLFAKIYGLPSSRVQEVMSDLQLTSQQDKKVEKLSKGWKQRVLIARALLHNPTVLILDEPTSGLDPNTATLLHKYIQDLNQKGITIIITTHDMKEADSLCNRIGIIDKGEMKAIGSPHELKERYKKGDVKISYLEQGEIIEKRMKMSEKESKEFLIQLIERNQLLHFDQRPISLADVFSEVTGGELS